MVFQFGCFDGLSSNFQFFLQNLDGISEFMFLVGAKGMFVGNGIVLEPPVLLLGLESGTLTLEIRVKFINFSLQLYYNSFIILCLAQQSTILLVQMIDLFRQLMSLKAQFLLMLLYIG